MSAFFVMADFLRAEQARRIANSEISQIMQLIKDSAYSGGLSIKLEYYLKSDTVNILKHYGYLIEEKEVPVYLEYPYGHIEDKPSSYIKETVISWDEDINNS